MEVLHFDHMPDMRKPYLLLTFAGWSDAANVATGAGRFLVKHLQAEHFASIDPEEFYIFADQRPQTRYNDTGQREIVWPANEFFVSHQPHLERDIIVCVGVEPHLKWRTFTNLMIEFIEHCDVYQTITLGALWADVLYSAPVPFSGSATDPALAQRLGVGGGRGYEGPTGMVGVLGDAMRRQNLTYANLWANMPYYVSAIPNPKGMFALGRRGLEFVGLPAALPELEEEARKFDTRVAKVIKTDPKVSAHVRELERRAQPEERPRQSQIQQGDISGEDIAAEFERFLREQRDDAGDN